MNGHLFMFFVFALNVLSESHFIKTKKKKNNKKKKELLFSLCPLDA